ncbi:MAG: ribosome biogenesis GTPase Der [Terriglobales bacterium]
MTAPPLVAILGRPNVGKSTLFNRLTRTRRSIVGDEPGITRDRIEGRAEWRGREFGLVDTGGMLPGNEEEIPAAIYRQAQTAIGRAEVLVMVVDGRTPLTASDLELARRLRRTGKTLLLAVNKIEGARQEQALAPYYELGIEPLFPISAEHGQGLEALLDAALERLPPAEAPELEDGAPAGAETRVAIIGRPNVGKSTLLNRLAGQERAIVSPVAGTTRDAVDAVVEHGRLRYRFVDTAGIRRKGATKLMAEKMSVVMARKHLELSELALILLDGAEAAESGVLALDATIAGYAAEARRACIIVVNKWDLAASLGRTPASYSERVRERMKFLPYAPIVFLSAQEGQGIPKLYVTMARVARERRKRIPTAALNRFLATVDFARVPVPAGQRLKVYYLSQVGVAPPEFVLFVDRARKPHFAWLRFVENRLREAFGFEGTPIVLRIRVSGAR